MRAFLGDIKHLWKYKYGFRCATVYLLMFVLLSLFIPWLPISYPPNTLDLQHILQPPFQGTEAGSTQPAHWLGTDALGRDVLSNVLYGARSGFFMAIPVMVIASFIGIMLGSFGGYYSDNKLKLSRTTLFIIMPLLLFGTYYYGLHIPLQANALRLPTQTIILSLTVLAGFILALIFIIKPTFKLIPFFRYKVSVPVDIILVRLIEVTSSIPWLIFILILASFIPPSITLIGVMLTLTSWMGSARLARAEMLRLKTLPYMEASISMGVPLGRLFLRHAFPNMLGPQVISFITGIAGLLTLESTLSFLGVGIPPDFVSWGRIITGIHSDMSAWWLVVFPGGALALSITALQVFSYYLLTISEQKKKA